MGGEAAVRFFSHTENRWFEVGEEVPDGAAGDHVLKGYDPDAPPVPLPEAMKRSLGVQDEQVNEAPKRRGRPRKVTPENE